MELTPIYKRVIGLDVHQAQISACALIEQTDGTLVVERREFGGFKRDRKALAQWAKSIEPDKVVMESTGIYWKPVYAVLEDRFDLTAGNAHHIRMCRGARPM